VELDQADSMPSTCVLSLDNVTPIAKGLLIERITTLGQSKLHQVCSALSAAVNC
jgi:mRNA-degrading endonuclease toxin of MazEF toxin-antitoxin module